MGLCIPMMPNENENGLVVLSDYSPESFECEDHVVYADEDSDTNDEKSHLQQDCLKALHRQDSLNPVTVACEVQKINFCNFPEKLGPWETPITSFVHKDFKMLDPKFESNNPFFVFYSDALNKHRELAKMMTFPLVGQTSPKFNVTLPNYYRGSINIPETAVWYVWSYPMDIEWWQTDENWLVEKIKELMLFRNPDLLFILTGGFIYLDRDFKVVGVNAVRLPRTEGRILKVERTRKGLIFTKKRKFEDKFIDPISRDDRFKLALHGTRGAKYFAWLKPNENIGASDNTFFTAGPHGCFVFLFSDLICKDTEEARKNCYYNLTCGPHCAGGDRPIGETCNTKEDVKAIKKLKRSTASIRIDSANSNWKGQKPCKVEKTASLNSYFEKKTQERKVPIMKRGVCLEVFQKLAKEFEQARKEPLDDLKMKFGRKPTSGEILVERVLKPHMGDLRVSYAEFLMQSDSSTIYRCNAYVTHAWNCDFLETVKAMEAFEESRKSTMYYFCDLLSVNQWENEEEQVEVNELRKLVGNVDELLCVLYPWNKPTLFGRLWFILEIAQAVQSMTNLTIKLPPSENGSFIEEIKTNLTKYVDLLRTIDAETAKASKPEEENSIRKVIQENMGGFAKCNREVYGQLMKWIVQQVYRIDENPDNPDTEFLFSAAKLLSSRGEANRRRALEMLQRCSKKLSKNKIDKDKKVVLYHKEEASILYHLDELEKSQKMTKKTMRDIFHHIQNDPEEEYYKMQFVELFYLLGKTQNGLGFEQEAQLTLWNAQSLAKEYFGKNSDKYYEARGKLGMLLLDQSQPGNAHSMIADWCKRRLQKSLNYKNAPEIVSSDSPEIGLAICRYRIGDHSGALSQAKSIVEKLEKSKFINQGILLWAKSVQKDVEKAMKKSSDGHKPHVLIEEDEEAGWVEKNAALFRKIDYFVNESIIMPTPILICYQLSSNTPSTIHMTCRDLLEEQSATGDYDINTIIETNSKIKRVFSIMFIRRLKFQEEECKDENSISTKDRDWLVNCFLLCNLDIRDSLADPSFEWNPEDKQIQELVGSLSNDKKTLQRNRSELEGIWQISDTKLDYLIRFFDQQFEAALSEGWWETRKYGRKKWGKCSRKLGCHIIRELRRNFVYTVQSNSQTKAELESRTKEKYWMRIKLMGILREIHAIFFSLDETCASNYIAKTILHFIWPILPIPYFETQETTEFKVNDAVIELAPMKTQTRIEEFRNLKVGKIIQVKNGRMELEFMTEKGIETKKVQSENLVRAFTWQCYRCGYQHQPDPTLWRDILPQKNWIECMKCGLVTLKPREYQKKRFMKRHMVHETGFGYIWFGYDSRSAQDVAIKVCNKECVATGKRRDNNEKVEEDVNKEIQLHRKVCGYKSEAYHWGIIRLIDTYEDDVNLNIVLDWADQGDLFDYVSNHFEDPASLSEKKVITEWQAEMRSMFYTLCSAVDFMHKQDIVHRDINLENTLLVSKTRSDGTLRLVPQICDLGLALFDKEREKFFSTVGKSSYWSPECGSPYYYGGYDGRKNDVWCLGVCLFQMLVGGRPYLEIEDEGFQAIYYEQDGLGRLLQAYERPHLVPMGALEILQGIFQPQRSRHGTDAILRSPWMKEAAFSMPHCVSRRKSTMWYSARAENDY